MAFTGHGHHIPGTSLPDLEDWPKKTRCGGVRICTRCKADVHEYDAKAGLLVGAPSDPVKKARFLIREYVTNHPDYHPVQFEVMIVTFSYILGGWKAHVVTNLEDELFYEVTYSAENHDISIGVYKKFHEVRIPD